jgi:stringent starvation protein B
MSEANRPEMPPRAPYFLPAMHAWLTDGGLTPQIIVDTRIESVKVPPGYSDENAHIVLNIGYGAVRELELSGEAASFNARFGGVPHSVYVPMAAILGIYARETGEGMVFNEDSQSGAPNGEGAKDHKPDDETTHTTSKPSLKIVK